MRSATIDGPAFQSLATGTGHGAELQVTGSGIGFVVDQQGTGRGRSSTSRGRPTPTPRHASSTTVGAGASTSCSPDSSGATGVQVSTAGSGRAVYARTTGAGSLGVGGRFTGKTAQVRLVAPGASSHPASGVKGDLFVDKSGRLWFCEGGSSWTQLA